MHMGGSNMSYSCVHNITQRMKYATQHIKITDQIHSAVYAAYRTTTAPAREYSFYHSSCPLTDSLTICELLVLPSPAQRQTITSYYAEKWCKTLDACEPKGRMCGCFLTILISQYIYTGR